MPYIVRAEGIDLLLLSYNAWTSQFESEIHYVYCRAIHIYFWLLFLLNISLWCCITIFSNVQWGLRSLAVCCTIILLLRIIICWLWTMKSFYTLYLFFNLHLYDLNTMHWRLKTCRGALSPAWGAAAALCFHLGHMLYHLYAFNAARTLITSVNTDVISLQSLPQYLAYT